MISMKHFWLISLFVLVNDSFIFGQLQLEGSEIYVTKFRFDTLLVKGKKSCALPDHRKEKRFLVEGRMEKVLLNCDSATFSNLELMQIKYILVSENELQDLKKKKAVYISTYSNSSSNYLILNKIYTDSSLFIRSEVTINNIKCYKTTLLQKLGIQKKDYEFMPLRNDYFENYISRLKYNH